MAKTPPENEQYQPSVKAGSRECAADFANKLAWQAKTYSRLCYINKIGTSE